MSEQEKKITVHTVFDTHPCDGHTPTLMDDFTPELKHRRIELEMKREEHELDEEWECCMFKKKTDSRLIKYLFQMCLIIAIMIMCVIKLMTTTNCTEQNTFVGILTMMVGIILPSPSMGKK